MQEAYELYRSSALPESKEAAAFRDEHGQRIPISVVARFDTVGSLGMPKYLPWPFSWFRRRKKYQFHSTELSDIIEYGIHLPSIDEDQRPFKPTRMQVNPTRGSEHMTKLFFPGFHGGVGGGDPEQVKFAENAMRFVVDEMLRRELGLQFDMEKIPKGGEVFQEHIKRPPRVLLLKALTGGHTRVIENTENLRESAIQKWERVGTWRPKAMKKFEDELLSIEN